MTQGSVKEQLKANFVGRTLHEIPTPSVILDIAKIEANCQYMLDAVERLSLSWRPHIKTHKTTELTRLQVGDEGNGPAKIVVSTVVEAENITPLLKEYQSKGREVNVLYGIPLAPSYVDRLAKVSSELGPGGLSLMIDHPDQLHSVKVIREKSGNAPLISMKIDMGYRRAGVIPSTPDCEDLISALVASEKNGESIFDTIYAHAGHSYETREDWKALDYLAAEFRSLEEVAAAVKAKRPNGSLVLSVGATPTTTSLQHPDANDQGSGSAEGALGEVNEYMSKLKAAGFELEVHAGVYPVLDLQQLATHARDQKLLNASAIAISILCEVCSVYPRRGPNDTTEGLVNGGCLAFGREPCVDMGAQKGHDYSGWGIVMPWGIDTPLPGPDFPAVHGGWQLGKVSQEHGILRWKGEPKDEISVKYGQRLRIWPNHACVAGACYNEYFIVDSRRKGKEDEIVDVWPRWDGW